MPSYVITAPDGTKHRVTGPGSAQDALAHFQATYKSAPPAEIPQPELPPATMTDRAMAVPTGVNAGIAGVLGLPVDTGMNIWDLAKAGAGTIQGLATGRTPSAIFEPSDRSQIVGTSEWIANQANHGGIATQAPRPDDPVSRYLHAGASGVPGALMGGPGGVVRQGMAGAASGVAAQGAAEAGLDPGVQALAALSVGAGAGARPQPKLPNYDHRATSPAKVARAAGLSINPSDIKGAPIGSLIEGGSGSAKAKVAMAQKNAPVITSHMREDLGMAPGPKLTLQEVEAARVPHNAKYTAITQTMPTMQFDAAFNKAALDAGSKRKTLTQFPEVVRLKRQYKETGVMDTDAVMGEIQMLRDSGHNNMSSAEIKTTPNRTELRAKGSAQLDIANALEDLIDRNAVAQGHGQLVPELRGARRELAKLATAKRSLIGDDVSPVMLRKMADRGVPLEGRMKLIADTTRAFPDVMRDVSKIKNKSAIGVLDVALPVTTAAITGQPLAAAGVIARPAGRAFLTSDRYQNTLGKPATDLRKAVPQYFRQPAAQTKPKAAQSAVKIEATPDGEIVARTDNGHTIARKRGGMLQVIDTQTAKGAQGKGENYARIKELIDEAQRRALTYGSDTKVSSSAAKTYDRLALGGYKVKKNPSSLDAEGNWVSDSGRPVFEVTGLPNKKGR